MSNNFIPVNTFPFTIRQLLFFDEELKEAGSFDLLMRRKDALLSLGKTLHVVKYDVEEYKSKYLTGIYEPLRTHYQTLTPCSFWARMYEMLMKLQKQLG